MDVEIDHGVTVGCGHNYVLIEGKRVQCFDECLLYSMKLQKERVLSGSIFGNVILWDKYTGKCIHTFRGH